VKKIATQFAEQVQFKVVCGGLFTGARVGYINKIAAYIKDGAYKQVEQTTGVQFGAKFLNVLNTDGDIYLDSVPPTTALCVVRDLAANQEINFASTLLSAVYQDGISPNDVVALSKYVTALGIDRKVFLQSMQDKKYHDMVTQDWMEFSKSPHSAMPALTLKTDTREIPISRGYADYDRVSTNLKTLL